jgi:S1-C subfamily serine protease
MNNIYRSVIVVLVAVGLVAGHKHTPKPSVKAPTTRYHGYALNREAIQRAKQFTVLISNEGFGGIKRGTGVLLDSTHVLTCAHVEAEGAWIYPYPGREVVYAKVIRMDQQHDLAILLLDRPVVIDHYATFQDQTYDGEPITIIGNALGGMKWFVSYGIISGSERFYLLTDGLVLGGNSGGPWINEYGQVVAISDWALQSSTHQPLGINGGVSAATIHAFFDQPSGAEMLMRLLGGQ